ncbi:MAG: putative glycoside hydrolase [Clostridiaceae bacterium]|nr:putative glycoside hydrolase [Clostridiaceae bacterium]
MRGERRINIFVGLLIIILASAGIVFLLSKLFEDFSADSGKKTAVNTPTQAADENPQASTPAVSPTSAAEQTPIPTPTPEPTPTPVPEPEYVPVKGLYLTTSTVGSPQRLQHYVDLANRTEINAYVFDIKDDYGIICYETNVPLAVKHGTWEKKYDVKEVLRILHDNGIRAIGRIVCFNDPTMPLKEPGLSLKNPDGSVFKVRLNNSHLAWLDPSNKEAWQYLIDIAKEASELGFDEIQYDYVRFPETTNFKYDMSYLAKEKSEYINEFMQESVNQLPGVIFSADIFGSICLQSKDAGGIGQTLETISAIFPYISPMIYPSHFANNSTTHYTGNGVGTNINGVLYPKPDLEPYNVVYNSLLITRNRLEKAGLDIRVRPFLQGFTANTYLEEGYYMEYGVEEYRAQIKAVYDAGYSEWLFWNSRNTYVEDAFLPE